MTVSFAEKKAALAARMPAARAAPLALAKSTSNLFRHRDRGAVRRLDLRPFHAVIDIDAARRLVEVEGLATYHELANATLARGFMPEVVPQLKSITIGGALAGGGIESSSFKSGFVHETIEEIEVLLGDGSTVVATPANEHRDLFFGFPNSYGTLGYALRVRARLAPVRRHVALVHARFDDPAAYFAALAAACDAPNDFVDGVCFGPRELVLTTGRFTDDAGPTSDYTYMQIYYQSLRTRAQDALTVYDYLWRWDADWFWCSRHFGVQNPLVRLLVGKFCLRSTFYGSVMRLNHRWGLTRRMGLERRTESVIQDVQIPIENCASFLAFFNEQIGILPVWLCPSRSPRPERRFSLYLTDPAKLYVNFGFWDVISSDQPAGHYNRLIERKVRELDGKKSLYSSSFYSEEEFHDLYNQGVYDRLKSVYDPSGAFPRLYDKAVRRR